MAGNVKTGASVTAVFSTSSPATGAATSADSTPTGTLYVNGTADAATVTVTNITTGRYKAAVTLPSLAAGDVVDIHIAATIGGVAGGGVVWSAAADTKRMSDTLEADVVAISGDSAAADNLEAAADGTGYNLGGGSVVAASVTGAVGSVTGAVGSVIDGVTLADGAITAAKVATGAIDADALAADAAAEIAAAVAAPSAATIADAVWDEALSGHATAGSAGAALTTAGGAADPLTNTVPGSYASGSAGHALGRIGSGQITTVSLVSQEGDITELIGGATYSAAAAASFDWTDADDVWPTLTAAAIAVSLAHPDGQTASYAGSVVTATGTGKKVRLELTAVQSAALQALAVGRWSMMVWATLSGGAVIPLVRGYANVVDRPGP